MQEEPLIVVLMTFLQCLLDLGKKTTLRKRCGARDQLPVLHSRSISRLTFPLGGTKLDKPVPSSVRPVQPLTDLPRVWDRWFLGLGLSRTISERHHSLTERESSRQ